jgi:hypothetical protein
MIGHQERRCSVEFSPERQKGQGRSSGHGLLRLVFQEKLFLASSNCSGVMVMGESLARGLAMRRWGEAKMAQEGTGEVARKLTAGRHIPT